MKRIVFLLLFLSVMAVVIGARFVLRAEGRDVTFYLQLVRGTDGVSPPSPDAPPVGPQLSRRLQMFRWEHYWEIKRQTVVLKPGGKTRQRLNPQREVEIEMTGPRFMTVSVYADGKLTVKSKRAVDAGFCIVGGDGKSEQSWFIVVRRDQPQDPVLTAN